MEASPIIEASHSKCMVKSEQLKTKSSKKTLVRKRFHQYDSYHDSSCHSVKPQILKQIRQKSKQGQNQGIPLYQTPPKITQFEVGPEEVSPQFNKMQSEQKLEVRESMEDEEFENDSCPIGLLQTPIDYLRSVEDSDDQSTEQLIPRIGTRKPLGQLVYIDIVPTNSRLVSSTFYTITALKEVLDGQETLGGNIKN